MTRRALELIAAADAILYDRLIPPGALDGARPDAELRYVGKQPGRAALPQEEINALLVELGRAGQARGAAEGRRPVRVRPRRRGGRGAGRGGRAVRGRARRDRRRGGPRLRGHPGDPPRRGLRGRVRHRPRGPGEGRDARSTGTRSPASPARSCFYMGVRRLPRIAERLVAAGRDPAEPAAVVERGHAPGPAHGHRARSPSIAARGRRPRACAPPAITVVGPGGRAARHARLARAAAAARRGGGGHARARAGERAGRAAARARRRGGRGAGDPDRAAPGRGRRARRRCAASATTRSSASRARTACALLFDALRGGRAATRARSPAPPWPRSAPARRASSPRRGIRADVVPERSWPRRWWRRSAGAGGGPPRARGARRRGARRAARRAARARRRGGRRRALRHRGGAARRRPSARRSRAPTYVTFTSSSTVRFFLEAGARPPTARGWCRSARSRARPRASSASTCTWRPSATTSTAWWRRCCDATARGCPRDRHPAHRLRPRRRVRGRLPRRDPPRSTRTREIVDITHGIPRHDVRHGALVLRNALPYMPVGRARGRRRSRRWAPSGARSRCAPATAACSWARQRPAQPGLGALRRASTWPWT